MKAWRVLYKGLMDEDAIFIAATRGQATAKALRQAQEAGYPAQWMDFRTRRAPEYDAWAARQTSTRRLSHGMSEQWVFAEAIGQA